MNSTFMKILLAYSAGMITVAVWQNAKISNKLESGDKGEPTALREDTTGSDTTSAGSTCACENATRYNVDPREDSRNYPISDDAACQAIVSASLVAAAKSGGRNSYKGAWFSKVTLDLMFCHAPDANGIYVYNGVITADGTTEPTFVVEAARTNRIISHDDGTATMYYSRSMCPTFCGACGM
jgi:hypothetical protein